MENSHSSPELGQIALVVSDVARAKQFYVHVLGLRPLFDAGPHLSFVASGAVRIMLTTPQGHGEVGMNSVLYFRGGPIDEVFRACLEKGATAERGPERVARLPDHELWMAFLRDPDGNLVGLMEERR